jgi:hypothetical protein
MVFVVLGITYAKPLNAPSVPFPNAFLPVIAGASSVVDVGVFVVLAVFVVVDAGFGAVVVARRVGCADRRACWLRVPADVPAWKEKLQAPSTSAMEMRASLKERCDDMGLS